MEGRELFSGFSHFETILFYGFAFLAIALFMGAFVFHIMKYARGAKVVIAIDWKKGFGRMVRDVMSHRTVRRRDPYAGMAHKAIFYGFLTTFIGTSIITLEYDILTPLFGITFWKGDFYLLFSLVVDLGGLAMVVGILMMMVRRARFSLPKLSYLRAYRGEADLRPAAAKWQREDWFFMCFLLMIVLSGFLQEAVRLLVERPEWQLWSPVGLSLSYVLSGLGVTVDNAAAVRSFNWWFHGTMALGFIVFLPWYKAKHILTAIGSLLVRDELALRRLSPVDEEAEQVGVSCMGDFDWKNLLHFDACTKCGRCHEVCPATNSGYPLSPRDLILDLREFNNQAQSRDVEGVELIGDIIDPETIWSCRTCGACQDICPVGIEHPAIIVDLRRNLVDKGLIDPILQNTLASFADKGNSFGESPKKRNSWTKELAFPIKDIRKQAADNLWFVGDYAAFDPRNQIVSQTFARLLKVAGVDYALLHEDERNAGNDVRRVGEEGLFESLAQHNIDQFDKARNFNRIITTDPHSYNTVKNEYGEIADVAPIEHYTSVLVELLTSGALTVTKPLNKKITFHDPCHLGRLNGGYDAPREVLEAIGCEIVEMPRNRDNSYCCGAGGGRIWIPDDAGTEKPSESRMHEAAELGQIDYFVTCCPKDLTMYEDARKTSGHEADFTVKDIAELVAEAIELDKLSLSEVPELVQKISDAVTAKVMRELDGRFDEIRQLAVSTRIVEQAVPVLTEPVVPISSDAAEGPWGIQRVLPGDFAAYDMPEKTGPKILVAIKHIGKILADFEIRDNAKDIDSDYLEAEFNEFDDNALEAALRLSESACNGEAEIIAVCIGGEDAEVTVRKALAKGADRAVRVWHDGLEGADSVVIARVLAGICALEQPDMVLVGVQSSDKTNGATGSLVAGILDLPLVPVVVGLDWDGGEKILVSRELEGGLVEKVRVPSKALFTVQTGAFEPRYATMRMIKKARKKTIEIVDGGPVVDDVTGYNLDRLYKPEVEKAQMLDGSPAEIARQISQIIKEKVGSGS